jgi:hypothetical protein
VFYDACAPVAESASEMVAKPIDHELAGRLEVAEAAPDVLV